jgi:predicted ATPase
VAASCEGRPEIEEELLMRIDRLRLERFKNLVQFEVDFDETSTRQVVVGRNGVGKSNLLEALTQIFRDLDLEEDSDFGYEIQYLCNGHLIKITSVHINKECDSNAGLRPLFKREYSIVPESHSRDLFQRPAYQEISEQEFFRRNRSSNGQPNPDRLLPLYVFGYYSGVISRFASIFEKHEDRYFREQIAGEEAPLRSLFQAKPHHSQFALLAFYATEDSSAQEFLKNEFRIVGLDSVLFALREPYWSHSTAKGKTKPGDSRFWFAGGKVAPFLNALFDYAFAPMSGRERMRISVGQEKTKERRYCFLPSQSTLQRIANGLSNKEFFARLESLVFSDLVDPSGSDVRIWITLKGSDEPTTFQNLAEGERQLLTVLGLMRFTAENEALFLLDEPDTHLNPAWCLDYLDNLRKYGAEPPNSQIIMTTHSPLTFAGMDKNEVVILERGVDGRIFADHPTTAPKGMGFAAILTSDFFGLRSTLDKATLKKLDEKRELALKPDKSDEDRQQLADLNAELGKLDFSQAARDPLYIEFIRAITAAQLEDPALKDAAPPKELWRTRQEIAKDIAKRLIKGGKQS